MYWQRTWFTAPRLLSGAGFHFPLGPTLRTSPDKGVPNGFATNQNACKEPCRTRSRGSFLAKQAAGARPILATGRPANEEFLHDIGSRAIGGAGHQDGLSPIVQVSVYDSVEHTHTMVEVPAAST